MPAPIRKPWASPLALAIPTKASPISNSSSDVGQDIGQIVRSASDKIGQSVRIYERRIRGDSSSTARPWRNTRTVPDVWETTMASALVWRVMPAAAM